MFSRTYRPSNTSTALARNGSRHPQFTNCASVSTLLSTRKIPPDRMNPTGAPSCGNIPYNARLAGGAFSTASNTAPPHSPPSPMPCPKRHSASSAGAASPTDAYPGSTPTTNVDKPMVDKASTSVFLRPILSPKWPKSADPMGRAMNAIANVASDAKVEVAGSFDGKNSRGNTSTAAVA